MRRAALAAFLAGLVAIVVFEVVPFMTKERDFPASITNPPALRSLAVDVVPRGARLCMNSIAAEAHSEQARIRVGTYGKPGPALELELKAPGYSARSRLAGGYEDNAQHAFDITPPRSDTLVEACILNRGPGRAALYAAADRAKSRAAVTIDGKSEGATPAFGFWERRPVSIGARAGVTVERIATFRGPFSHAWIIWIVLALFVLGLTAGLAAVIWRGFPRE